MSDIVLLSRTANAPKVLGMVDALVEDRQDVRWVQVGPDGTSVADASAAVEAARCVVVAWSVANAEDSAFEALTRLAVMRKIAIGALLDNARPAPQLSAISWYEMQGWRGRPGGMSHWLGGNLYIRDLVTAAKYKVAGRDPPPPSAPRNMLVRQLLVLIPAAFAAFAIIPSLYGFWVDLGLRDRPDAVERRAWDTLDKTDCAAIRTFRTRFRDGKLSAEAQALLDGAVTRREVIWESLSRNMPVLILDDQLLPMPNEAAARATLAPLLAQEAKLQCKGLADAGQGRVVNAPAPIGEQPCKSSSEGYRCPFNGKTRCAIELPREVEVEQCGA